MDYGHNKRTWTLESETRMKQITVLKGKRLITKSVGDCLRI